MTITLTNKQIYNYTNSLAEHFPNDNIKLPIKVNFYLQKNQVKLYELAQEIEQERVNIIKEYGVLNSETEEYEIPQDKIQEASVKITELFNIIQEVKIYKVSLNDFNNIELTAGQMKALLFMIKEEGEE